MNDYKFARLILLVLIVLMLSVMIIHARSEETGFLPLRMVWADALNVREEPSTEADIILTIDRGVTVFVQEETADGWCYVLHNPSRIPYGWVYGGYLK